MPDIQDILILWIVRFGEDCTFDMATAQYMQDKFIGPWYTALSNAGRLAAYHTKDGVLRIRVVEQEETCSGKQASIEVMDEVERADLHALRDLWEVTWGRARKGIHQNSRFWWAVAQRLADTGWLHRRPSVTPTVVFYQLKEDPPGPQNKE